MTSKEKEDKRQGKNYEEFKKFADEFHSESDRAAVILGAAKLDLLLYQIIQKHLRPSTSGRDELFEGEGPISTFSSKINIAYRLGLLSAEFARSLHLIRKIRNSFAHEFSGVSLDAGSHRDRIRELIAPIKEYKHFDWLIDTYFGGDFGPASEFRAAVAMMSLRLEGCFDGVEQCDTEFEITLLPYEGED